MKGFSLADSLIDVFDRYDCPGSTKAAERSRVGNNNKMHL